VITGDYEGGGKGDVYQHRIKPTYEIMQICEDHGAKYTIFADVCEYWTIKNMEKSGKLKLAYSATGETERQLKEMIRRGHDVQLHLHPQWLEEAGCQYTNDGWKWNLDYFRLPNLPEGNPNDRLSIRGLFHQGVKTLEELLTPIDPTYKCIAFRAGGYCIQPSETIIKAMLEVGILADSSVAKGAYNTKYPYFYDFRNAHSNCDPWWADPKDITKASEDNKATILEVPIYSCPRTIFHRILGRSSQWDYCILNSAQLISMFKKYLSKHTEGSQVCPGIHIIVMMGHPKLFHRHHEFKRCLQRLSRYISQYEHIKFSTMREAVEDFYRSEGLSCSVAKIPYRAKGSETQR